MVGLSPRMRGNRRARHDRGEKEGSIPAHAGEPRRGPQQPAPDRVYPRACGGTSIAFAEDTAWLGLSPRMRGNRHHDQEPDLRRGSIPAHAGEPRGSSSPSGRSGVYPRACGGTERRGSSTADRSGLSPRMRGNQSCRSPTGRKPGSIPAHAGEPRHSREALSGSRVYPRACGGTCIGRCDTLATMGLSPRMRGNPARSERDPATDGSIPAHAGEPSSR